MYDTRAVFENSETGNCLVVTQIKDGRDLKSCDRSQLPDISGPCVSVPIEAIFGIYDLLSGSYVAVVVESEPFVATGAINIRKVKKILILPLFRNGRLLSEQKQKDENIYLNLLHQAFASHSFFFSATCDITLSQQRQAMLSQNQLSKPIWARADDRFFWNHKVIEDLIACEADQWIVPFMSAFIDIKLGCEIAEENVKFSLLFISRRSRYRQGCRFTRRGIDEDGHVANFVETEQILLFPDGKITSYVQIRGSIPVHWSSPVHMKYDPVVQIDEDRNFSVDCCEKHVNSLVNVYSDNDINCNSIVFLNLIDNKKDQGKLGVEFKETIDATQNRIKGNGCSTDLVYIWFDFHAECKKKGKWNNLSKLVKQIDSTFRKQKFFCKLSSGIVSSWQCGVVRTNCMDNLDRTNVVQSLIARRSLLMQLGKTDLLDGGDVMNTPWKKFESLYKSLWAKNADALALMYAGTGALKVDFTLTGKRTFKGMYNDGVNAVMRYYINNFTDGMKQDSIDMVLGNFKPDPQSPISPFIPRPNQETLADNFIKAFVTMVGFFSFFLICAPYFRLISTWAAHSAYFGSKLYMFIKMSALALANGEDISDMQQPADAVLAPIGDPVVEMDLDHVYSTDDLNKHVVISMGVTMLVALYAVYSILKLGSPIGEKMVVLPQLVKEPKANAR